MAIVLEKKIRPGWKRGQNERFGDCLEVRFRDPKTDKVLFTYAPKCEDRKFWEQLFQDLEEYDKMHKEIMDLRRRIVPGEFLANGCGERVKPGEGSGCSSSATQ